MLIANVLAKLNMSLKFVPVDSSEGVAVKDGVKSDRYNFNMDFSKGRKELFAARIWSKADKKDDPKGLVFLSHGFAEYINDAYDNVARTFVNALDVVVFAHDHVGHGDTSGQRAQISGSFQEDLVRPVLEHCRAQKAILGPTLPLFILGHSMGGLITVLACLEDSDLFTGAILNAPLIEIDPSLATPLNLFLAKWLSFFWPSKQLDKLDENDLSRDKDKVAPLKLDPKRYHEGMKAKQAYATLLAMESLEKRFKDFKTPILIQHGSKDKLTRPEGSQKLHDKISSEDKIITVYDSAFHNLFIEIKDVSDKVVEEEVNWIKERIQQSA